jgi:hypothetical protein
MSSEASDNQVKETAVEHAKTQFILKGFTEAMGFRIFAFEGIAADRTRSDFTVKTDLALSRRYGIRLQELPLLCRALLEQRDETAGQQSFTYTEEEMSSFAAKAAAREEAAKQKKAPRRPAPEAEPADPSSPPPQQLDYRLFRS